MRALLDYIYEGPPTSEDEHIPGPSMKREIEDAKAQQDIRDNLKEYDHVSGVFFQGHYRPARQALMSWPPKYPHRCDACGDARTFDETYPHIEYEDVTP